MKILLVEDNQIAQKVACFQLSNLGYTNVDTAKTGAEALRCLNEQAYDCIFMDLGLIDTTGFQLTQIIRDMAGSKNSQTVIIALTAHQDPETAQRCLQSGMNAFVSKPLTQTIIQTLLMHHGLVKT